MSWFQYRLEQIADHLYSQFPGLPLTVLEAYVISLAVVFAIIGVYFAVKLGTSLREYHGVDSFFMWAECEACGWKGETPRAQQRCPICGSKRLRDLSETRGKKSRKRRKAVGRGRR